MTIKQNWSILSSKVEELSLRERILILLVGLVIIIYPTYNLVLSTWWHDTQVASSQLQSQKTQIRQTKDLIDTITQQLQINPNKALDSQRLSLQEKLQNNNQEFKEKAAELVRPKQMASLLKRVLDSSKHLTLITLDSIAPKPLLTDNQNDKPESKNINKTEQIKLYTHGMKLSFSGTYFNIYNYLNALEQLPEKFYWKQLNYTVIEYPISKVEIEIYTLSTQKEFIGG